MSQQTIMPAGSSATLGWLAHSPIPEVVLVDAKNILDFARRQRLECRRKISHLDCFRTSRKTELRGSIGGTSVQVDLLRPQSKFRPDALGHIVDIQRTDAFDLAHHFVDQLMQRVEVRTI